MCIDVHVTSFCVCSTLALDLDMILIGQCSFYAHLVAKTCASLLNTNHAFALQLYGTWRMTRSSSVARPLTQGTSSLLDTSAISYASCIDLCLSYNAIEMFP